ncbi:MAG TPA: CHAT domain-containing protein, partial [Blastocatellia bacterium]|nr:CHAT domain-containing protein [Blastocatellia bacterium]
MSDQELTRERGLRAGMASLNAQLLESKMEQDSNEAVSSGLEARLEEARVEYEAFQTELYAAHSELRVQRAQVPPVTIDNIADLFPEGGTTAFLEFVVLTDKTFLFVLTRTSTAALRKIDLRVYVLPVKQKQLAEQVQGFRQALAEHRLNVLPAASQLYDLLLRPAQVQLQGTDTLTIVPDDVLWQLPFQALRQPDHQYLIEGHVISYVPSLTVLRELMRKRRPDELRAAKAPRMLLAFGGPAMEEGLVERAKTAFADQLLEPLPEAEREVQLLGQLYGKDQSTIFTGIAATKNTLKAQAGNYRILHLATHAVLNDSNPMYSQLLLSSSGAAGSGDEFLEAWEIMQLDLRADLVVLSACETGRGRIGAGEGVIGLSWALFVAGAPTAVVSQWKVESKSNTEFMLEFHKQIRNDLQRTGVMNTAAALRQAALKLLGSKQYDDPFYWAPFVVVGNGMGNRSVR